MTRMTPEEIKKLTQELSKRAKELEVNPKEVYSLTHHQALVDALILRGVIAQGRWRECLGNRIKLNLQKLEDRESLYE